MRNIITLLTGIIVSVVPAFSQLDRIYDFNPDEKGMIETLAKIEKKTDKFNLFLNMQGSFNMDWNGSEFNEAKFRMDQLRIEAKGDINDWLSYRYRQRLNKGNDLNGYRDNVMNSIDVAGFGLKLKKWSIFLGKQCAVYGGIEFEYNPIEIYQYSDMVSHMSSFMTGINVAYNFTPRQQLQFQILNAYNGSSREMYGDYQKAKIPLIYTLNWNGSFSNIYRARWSASFMNETKGEHRWYYALGNDFYISDKFQIYFDWMYLREGVDRQGIITEIVQNNWQETSGYKTAKTDMMSFLLHVNYHFHPQWNIFGKVMAENAGVYQSTQQAGAPDIQVEKGRYRTAWGYIGGIEFYPMKDRNLHFFAAYVGRSYRFASRAKAFGRSDYSTNRLSVGFIWAMPVF